MSGYFGTEQQQRLQAQAEASVDFIRTTPGACQAGRTMGCDDPDRLGWDRINEFLDRDGICGFRLIPNDTVTDLKSRLMEKGFRLDIWDVFLADRAAALAASEAILSHGLPHGLVELDEPTGPESDYTGRIQVMMAGAVVVPFSGSMLTGAIGPATTIVIGDQDGNVVAAAHGYLPHNAYSDYHRHAWGGLVAVAPTQRGKGLGNFVNARMITNVFGNLGATHIYQLVSSSNIPSRRMVATCGLRYDPHLVCGLAIPNAGAAFTR